MPPGDQDAGESQGGKKADEQGNPAKLPAQPGPSGAPAKLTTDSRLKLSEVSEKKRKQERLSDTTTVNAATATLTTVSEGQTPTSAVGCGVQS